jgi:hypothetical protein
MTKRAFKRVFLPVAGAALLLLLLVHVLATVLKPIQVSGSERDLGSDQARIEFLQHYLPVAIPHGTTRIKFEVTMWLDLDLQGSFNVPSDMLADFVASLREKCHVIGTTDKTVRFSFSKILTPPSKSDCGEQVDGEIEVEVAPEPLKFSLEISDLFESPDLFESDTGRTTISLSTRQMTIPNSKGKKSKPNVKTTPDTFGDRKTDSSDIYSPFDSGTQSHLLPRHATHGNAWQWCADWYDKDYYGKSPLDDPKGADTGDGHVLRGGSWRDGPYSARSAIRLRCRPDFRSNGTGFRVARTQQRNGICRGRAHERN